LKAIQFIRNLYHAQGKLYNPTIDLKIVEPPTVDYLLDLLPEKVRDKVKNEIVGLGVTATLKGEVLWVALENGDILAVSPILPFPARIEAILEKDEPIEGISTRKKFLHLFTC
jgi:hypothetical protein